MDNRFAACRTKKKFAFVTLALALCSTAGCSDRIIHYEILRNTREITGLPIGTIGGSFLPANQVITIYKITEVENKGSSAFTFDTERTFACSADTNGFLDSPATQDYGRLHFTRPDGSEYAPAKGVSVPAGTTATPDVRVVISHDKTNCNVLTGTGDAAWPILQYDQAGDAAILPSGSGPVNYNATISGTDLP